MSIKRYTNEPFGAFAPCENGDYVLYTDHTAELHNILFTLADIRAALGVGDKPMLEDLPKIVSEIRGQADRDEKAACKAKEERDSAVKVLKEVLATPTFGARHEADAVDTIREVRAILDKIEGGKS